ncbi:carboxylesterase/lipase family protein [Nocardia bovistercoris]|uniref:Carboxylic ester hydrolase n=1 Tax=Nocardia bovistercoris TaxID=2785916 RepID=A0A931I8T0_9NOCA|nr:carboxylesterase/lipase family protein [Nocardia bovistercoris]MBH0776206.1 carboxylesterase/lipase family protein [Nocardia bovistercoris]
MVATIDVPTADGVVRGRRGRRVLRWRSLPYAAAPVGDLRFRAPQPVRPWTGVREATAFRFASVQHRGGARIGPTQFQPMSEDCLTLNVTASAQPSSTPRPVLVFVHGGGYVMGTSALGLYSGARLAIRGDVVVVSLNYRLGAFGYVDFSEFGTPDRPIDSNLGLRDQVAALRWVRENIAAFGGDPGNVTVFGESAGAHAVLSLMTAPAARGLFHRAIAQSPPADWGMPADDARAFARRCVEALDADTDDAVRALSDASANDIGRAVSRVLNRVLRERPGVFPAAPVIDGDYLPVSPLEALTSGTAQRVPLIIGTCRNEGALFARFLDQLPTRPERLRAALAEFGEEATGRVIDAYPGFPEPRTAIRAGGDFVFWRPSITAMEGHSKHAPTYAYRYDFAPRALHLAGVGATHATDLIPVFGAGDTPLGRAMTAAGGRRGLAAVTRQFQDNWIEFARTGTPLPSWPAYTEARRTTLVIDSPTRLENDPDQAARLAWQPIGVPSAA